MTMIFAKGFNTSDDHDDGHRERTTMHINDELSRPPLHVVIAIEESADGWAGAYLYTTFRRARTDLELHNLEIQDDPWEVWSTADGRRFWLCREVVK